jgi:uncharacterized membrane protein
MFGRAFVVAWFLLGGIGHFVLTDMFTSIVPPFVPYPRGMVLFTGACEIAGALALLYKPLRHIGGWCIIALTVCVTPVHIQMLVEADKYRAIGAAALWARLLFQPVLIWIIWASTKRAANWVLRNPLRGPGYEPRAALANRSRAAIASSCVAALGCFRGIRFHASSAAIL